MAEFNNNSYNNLLKTLVNIYICQHLHYFYHQLLYKNVMANGLNRPDDIAQSSHGSVF